MYRGHAMFTRADKHTSHTSLIGIDRHRVHAYFNSSDNYLSQSYFHRVCQAFLVGTNRNRSCTPFKKADSYTSHASFVTDRHRGHFPFSVTNRMPHLLQQSVICSILQNFWLDLSVFQASVYIFSGTEISSTPSRKLLLHSTKLCIFSISEFVCFQNCNLLL